MVCPEQSYQPPGEAWGAPGITTSPVYRDLEKMGLFLVELPPLPELTLPQGSIPPTSRNFPPWRWQPEAGNDSKQACHRLPGVLEDGPSLVFWTPWLGSAGLLWSLVEGGRPRQFPQRPLWGQGGWFFPRGWKEERGLVPLSWIYDCKCSSPAPHPGFSITASGEFKTSPCGYRGGPTSLEGDISPPPMPLMAEGGGKHHVGLSTPGKFLEI